MGESLEMYVKNLFANTTNLNKRKKESIWKKTYSWEGSQNNPPDLILRNGDAIEVKKIQSPKANLALNSSYPKDFLRRNDRKISAGCKRCEDWELKDIIYIIGCVKNKELKYLNCFMGDCIAAKPSIYEGLLKKISGKIEKIQEIDCNETNELARINGVDPLKLSNLRVRGVWEISNPIVFLGEKINFENSFLNLVMREKKYQSFPRKDLKNVKRLIQKRHIIEESVELPEPSDPTKTFKAIRLFIAS